MGVLREDSQPVLKVEEENQGHFLNIDLKDIGGGWDVMERISGRGKRI